MKTVSAMMLALLFTTTFTLAFYVPSVEAAGTIYVGADGSIDPPTAPIYTADNVTYTLTDNITAFTDGIVIERDNIVVDGAGYTLTGSGVNGNGATLTDRSNVTVRNMTIKNFTCGILLDSSPNNTLSGNNISGNEATGISLYSSPNNVLSGNTVEGNQINLLIVGFTLSDYLLSIDTSNLVERKPVYYFINQSDMMVDTDTYPKVGYMGFVNCVNVTVQGLNLTENGDGLLLAFTNNSKITGNNVTNQSGIWLKYSFDITLSDNNITNNWYGVDSHDSSNITLSGNNIAYNYYGIYADHSSNMTLSSNNVTYNSGCGITLWWWSQNNTLSGNNVTNNGDGIIISEFRSFNNSAFGNNIASNRCGINLFYCSYNRIFHNNVTNHWMGIYLSSSSNNNISGNNITQNKYHGILLDSSSDNCIYHNNFVNNTQQVDSDDTSTNFWDDGYPSGGNYRSNYNGTDANNDGIGDTPYVIDANNTDPYPLMTQYIIPEFSFLSIPLFMIATLLAVITYRRKHP